MIITNLNIIACYNSLEEYESSYDLSRKQMLTLNSIGSMSFYTNSTKFHHIISCLGGKKYGEIIKLINEKELTKMKYAIIFLIAKYMIDVNEYIKELNYFLTWDLDEEDTKIINIFNDILIGKKLERIEELFHVKHTIPTVIINIIKKMFEVKN